jgi:hypothetical protein
MMSSSGTYPAITTASSDDLSHKADDGAVTLELSSRLAGATGVTLTGKFTPSKYIPALSMLVVTINGNGFPSGTSALSASSYVRAQGEKQTYHTDQFNRFPNYVRKKLFWEMYRDLGPLPSDNSRTIRDDILTNPNFISNNPGHWFFREDFTFSTTSPNEDYYAYRVTGAICPNVSGVYDFHLVSIDDGIEFYLMRDDESVFNRIIKYDLATATEQLPQSFNYTLTAGHKYALLLLFVERTGLDYMSLQWKTPEAASYTEIPPDAFCTGWATMSSNVLQVSFPWPLLAYNEVSFTVLGVSNPISAQPSSIVSSGHRLYYKLSQLFAVL